MKWGFTYFEIGCKLIYDDLPGNKAFDEDVCWFQVYEFDVLLDKGLRPRQVGVSTAVAGS